VLTCLDTGRSNAMFDTEQTVSGHTTNMRNPNNIPDQKGL